MEGCGGMRDVGYGFINCAKAQLQQCLQWLKIAQGRKGSAQQKHLGGGTQVVEHMAYIMSHSTTTFACSSIHPGTLFVNQW